ncbi:MAG: cysteine--tRNA ligase [Actinobacteria bacterium]|nr:MAG: cysteine--tRNA ligase [Actinomycetota bacterium]
MLRLHDTAKGEVVELTLRDTGKMSMYVCGLTVYDVPHIGHGRAALVYDVLRRYLEWSGLAVRHVSNITDIDDQIINRATEQGRSAEEVAQQYEAAWYDATDRLGVLRPTADPHATAYVDDMVSTVEQLVRGGHAYETSDGVYFAVESIDGYGLLAQQSLDDLRAGARVEVTKEKRSPLDFALWKKAKPGEPEWPSPWGPGRPGWHTECVVMSLDLLGDGFDLHTGGLDLQFPHHENERAQAVALGRTFARHWMHHAFVEVGGEKMSKSLKNFTSLPDLLSRHDARAYRLLVLRSHYRSPMEVTPDTIADAEGQLERFDSFARRHPAPPPGTPLDDDLVARFRAFMDDDLDTPPALGLLFEELRRANVARDTGVIATVHALAGALGLWPRGADQIDAETARDMAERDAARAARDWARADEIRARLQARGWVVEDGADGTTVHR